MISVTAAGILRPLLPLLSALAVVSAAQAGIDPDLTEGDAAGRVRLTDGSVIVGTVSEIRDGTVVVENTFNDDALKIPVALVASFERAQSTDLMINEGETITLASVQVVDGNIQLPEGELALSDVYIMNPEDWEEGRGFNWSGDTSAALAVARGNTDTNEIDVSVNTVIERSGTGIPSTVVSTRTIQATTMVNASIPRTNGRSWASMTTSANDRNHRG